jgi:hypothetical protein
MRTLLKFLLITFSLLVIPFGNKAYGVTHIETITFETEDDFFEHIITEAILSITPKSDYNVDLVNLFENDTVHFAFTSPYYSFFIDTPIHNLTHLTKASIQFTVKF